MPKEKRNPLGFTEKQLKIILDFCRVVTKDPKIFCSEFHRKYNPYSRKQTTIDLIYKAYKKSVLIGPYLFCNKGYEVTLLKGVENPFELLKEKKKDKAITYVAALFGEWDFMYINRGASLLEYAQTIIPNRLSNKRLETIYFDEPGKLKRDPYPTGWDEMDWKIYDLMGDPRAVTFREAGQNLDIPWSEVHKRYEKLLTQCKTLCYFLPLGYLGYQYMLLTFKTKYEIGLINALKRLDRSSYILKWNDTIILTLFLLPTPLAINTVGDRFKELEEIGILHDLRVSIPIRHYKPNISLWTTC